MKIVVMKKQGESGRMELHVKESGKVDVWRVTGVNKYYRGQWNNMTDAMNAMRGIGYRSERQYEAQQ